MRREKKYCLGCDDNFYNGNNPMGIKECWGFKTAKIVVRWCIGWWTPMDKKENFWKVTTHDCHTETGKLAYLEKLPSHLGQ